MWQPGLPGFSWLSLDVNFPLSLGCEASVLSPCPLRCTRNHLCDLMFNFNVIDLSGEVLSLQNFIPCVQERGKLPMNPTEMDYFP